MTRPRRKSRAEGPVHAHEFARCPNGHPNVALSVRRDDVGLVLFAACWACGASDTYRPVVRT